MNEGLFQGESICDHQQDNRQQDIIQHQNDQLVFIEDRSLNLVQSIKMVLISNDEKYLATLTEWRKIQIYYLKNKKLIKNLQLNNKKNRITTIKFYNNSRHLLFGDNYGCLGCFDINNNNKIIYNQRVHSCSIENILSIDDDQIITSSYDYSIIITSVKYDQQLLKIEKAHSYNILVIEFDKVNDYIISLSSDCSIKFFNKKDGKLEIIKQFALFRTQYYGIFMIQLIQKDNNLLTACKLELILWQIDYLYRNLIKLKEINSMIFNFTSVFNNNKIVVICEGGIIMLDKDLEYQSTIYYLINDPQKFKTRQLDSLNYILIEHDQSFVVLKKVRKLKN